MEALFICENLLEYLAKEKIVHGFLHSVFNSACNLETQNGFITLLKKDRLMAPMSILLKMDDDVSFSSLGVQQNYKFSLDVNGLSCKETPFCIELKDAKPWYPGVIIKPTKLSEKDAINNVRKVERALPAYIKSYGIELIINLVSKNFKDLNLISMESHINRDFEFINDRFVNFLKTAIEADIRNIAERAETIIGFGPGLTPSIDDFINGFMIALIYWGNFYGLDMKKIYCFNRTLVSKSLNKTTRVSAEMLKHGAQGRVNEAVRELMLSMLYERDGEKLIRALQRTISFGETSGSDTVLGIYMASKILTNFKYRRIWESEAVCGY